MKLIIVEIYKQHKEPLTRASTREISLIFISIKEKLHGAFTDEFKKIVVKHGTSNSRVKFVFLNEDWGLGYFIERKIIFWRSHESSHINMAEIF